MTQEGKRSWQYRFDDGLAEMREDLGLEPLDKYAGEVSCLKCQRRFTSPNRKKFRVCDRCKGQDAWVGSRATDALYPGFPEMNFRPRRERKSSKRQKENARRKE